jgi:RecJ-like exonuclease
MKNSLLFLFCLVVLFSCSNQSKQNKDSKSAELVILTVDDIQAQGKELVGKEVRVKGTVTHVCKESGARCFVMGSTEDVSIRIEAGKIGSFSQEQMGSDIQVRGILREVQLDEEDLAEMEKSAKAGESANIGHALGSDAAGMHTVVGGNKDSIIQAEKLAQINQKLAESKEGYVPVYYLDGIELIQQK